MPPIQTSQQKVYPPIFITILILLAGIFGVVKVYDYLIIPGFPTKGQPSPLQFQIADWKTYRNGEYGFEFKYPPEWKEESLAVTDQLFARALVPPGAIYPREKMDISIYSNPSKKSVFEFFEIDVAQVRQSATNVSVGGKQAIRLLDDPGNTNSTSLVSVQNNDLLYIFAQPSGISYQVFYQILYTFKFTR